MNNISPVQELECDQTDSESFSLLVKPDLKGPDSELINKCFYIIENHIDDEAFSVEMLAKKLNYSNRNLYRKMREITNLTPAELIRLYKLYYAKQLLQNTNMKVFEIVMAVGYKDIKGFRSTFKKQFGVLPSQINSLGEM